MRRRLPRRQKPPITRVFLEADDGIRTRDTWLGKPVLYQLSYVRAPGILAAKPDSASDSDATFNAVSTFTRDGVVTRDR